MYKSIRKKSWFDMQDETQHVYQEDDKFPFDDREINESRVQELSTDLNKLHEPLIKIESELLKMSKKDIMKKFDSEGIEYDKTNSKDKLIFDYEYHRTQIRLLEEASNLDLNISEDLSNYEITELILSSQENNE